MGRTTAVIVLGLLALGAIALGVWGVRDVLAAQAAMRACADPVSFDLSAFWFVGFASIALLPMLSLTPAPGVHRLLLSVVLLGFLSVPLVLHHRFMQLAIAQGYETAALASAFQLQHVALSPQACVPVKAARVPYR